MGGDAILGVLVHLDRANLHFERLALGPDDRGVQRAIAVGFRLRDVIVELAGERRPHVMDDAERRVTIADVVDQDAHGADVVERVDADFLAPHLFPDAIDVLGPSRDVGPNAGLRELASQKTDDAFDIALAVGPALVQHLRDRLVGSRLEGSQAQVLELPFELPDTEPVGERREQIQNFARRALARIGNGRSRRNQVPHRLRPLGELDQHDANILDHREQHLAQPLRLRGAFLPVAGCGQRADLVHACHTGHEASDVGTESLCQIVAVELLRCREANQKRRADGRRVELERGNDLCRARSVQRERLAIAREHIGGKRLCIRLRGAKRLDVTFGVRPAQRLEPRIDSRQRGCCGGR